MSRPVARSTLVRTHAWSRPVPIRSPVLSIRRVTSCSVPTRSSAWSCLARLSQSCLVSTRSSMWSSPSRRTQHPLEVPRVRAPCALRGRTRCQHKASRGRTRHIKCPVDVVLGRASCPRARRVASNARSMLCLVIPHALEFVASLPCSINGVWSCLTPA